MSAPRAQLLGQRVNPHHTEVNVRSILGPARANLGRISAVEEHLHLITPNNCENGSSIRNEADALSVPVARYLEAENVTVILGCPHQIRYGELGHRRNEANGRWYLAHQVHLSVPPNARTNRARR
jgi:hypothetical protein